MASFFKKIGQFFGITKKKKKAVDVPSPYETPQYGRYKQKLEEMLAKKDVYSPEFMAKATSPYAKTMRAGLKAYTIPAISAQASARGVGRSTIPVSMIRQAGQETEMSIAEKMAQLALANEQEKARRELVATEALRGEAIGRADVEARRIAAHEEANGNLQD